MPDNSVVIRNCTVVIPQPGNKMSVKQGDILIQNGTISAVGQGVPGALSDKGREISLIDGSGCIALPGFTNAHTHSVELAIRGLRDGLPLGLWLEGLGDNSGFTPADVYHLTRFNSLLQIQGGCTSCVDHFYLNGVSDMDLEVLKAAIDGYDSTGVRTTLCLLYLDSFYSEADGMVDIHNAPADPPNPQLTQTLISRLKEICSSLHDLETENVKFGLGPAGPQLCSKTLLEESARLSEDLELPVQMHFLETRDQRWIQDHVFKISFVDRLAEVGILSKRTSLAHCVWLSKHEYELLAERQVSVVHSPSSNLRFGSGIAPVATMLEFGTNVAMGTDGIGTDGFPNMFVEMRHALLLSRLADSNFDRWLSSAQVLAMATLNGARMYTRHQTTGCIQPGDRADLVLVEMSHRVFAPLNSLTDQLVLGESGSGLKAVIIGGRTVWQNGDFNDIDIDATLAAVSRFPSLAGPNRPVPEARAMSIRAFCNRAASSQSLPNMVASDSAGNWA